ncbi:MAG: uroporphyrinogen decarboxylase family protein [Christensenellales bacterium]
MTSKERVLAAINHKQPDRTPIDIGSAYNTGISVSALYRLRDYLGLPEKDITVYETMQMLGYVDEDVRKALGGDVVALNEPIDFVGVPLRGETQPFTMPDGTPTRIHRQHQYDVQSDGKIYLYPQGNRSVKPSAVMPAGGYFWDCIHRAAPFDEDDLTPEADFKNMFIDYSDESLRYFETEAKRLDEESGCAVMGLFGKGSIGDPSSLPGPSELQPKGIRNFQDWSMAQLLYPEYCRAVFEMQTEYVLRNLKLYHQAVGDHIQIVVMSGTDFGTQNGLMISKNMFQNLYKPYYTRMNQWVHAHTKWKVFFHSCGSIMEILDDFVEMGVDIINPVQLSAKGMDPAILKEKYGDKLVFWGGGVDTQDLLPNGTPEQIRAQVQQRLRILASGGGYVFNTIHNIMGDVRPENIMAAFDAAREWQDES